VHVLDVESDGRVPKHPRLLFPRATHHPARHRECNVPCTPPCACKPSVPWPRPKPSAPGLKTMSPRPLQQAHHFRDHTIRLSLQRRLGAPPAVPNGFQPWSTVDRAHLCL
jgi:hypothetical protein